MSKPQTNTPDLQAHNHRSSTRLSREIQRLKFQEFCPKLLSIQLRCTAHTDLYILYRTAMPTIVVNASIYADQYTLEKFAEIIIDDKLKSRVSITERLFYLRTEMIRAALNAFYQSVCTESVVFISELRICTVIMVILKGLSLKDWSADWSLQHAPLSRLDL